MKQKALFFIISMFLLATNGFGQAVNPLAYYNDRDGNALEGTSIDDGEAPLNVRFRPNPSNMGEWIPSYEWHFIQTKSAESQTPKKLFVRYDEEVEYTFNESGTYNVYLKTYLKKTDSTTGTEDTAELDSVTLTITIAESKLEFPNAFSPNDDGINDVYGAKKDFKSIVSFRAIILNRWGQKLYEWNDPAGGWDGTYNGNDVKQGVYYVFVQAKGADGKDYKIRKDVNLLRGYTENKNTGDE